MRSTRLILTVALWCLCIAPGCGSEDPAPTPPQGGAQTSARVEASTPVGEVGSSQVQPRQLDADHVASGGARPVPGGPRVGGQASTGGVGHRPLAQPPSGGSAPTGGVPVVAPTPPPEVQQAMSDPRFAEFRRMCGDLHELRAEVAPLNAALATGRATQAQIDEFWKLEQRIQDEIKSLNAYKWQDRWLADDRRTMSMIMHFQQ